jgi:hypothetical protein
MGAIALVLLESSRRARPLGLLGLSLAGMLLVRPAWLHDDGFQLSAAAAGLVLTARPLGQALARGLRGAASGGEPRWLGPPGPGPRRPSLTAPTDGTEQLQRIAWPGAPVEVVATRPTFRPLAGELAYRLARSSCSVWNPAEGLPLEPWGPPVSDDTGRPMVTDRHARRDRGPQDGQQPLAAELGEGEGIRHA